MNDLLTVNNLTKTYDRFALQNLSFSLPEGCITGFIGANGAGKTTTLRTILDLIHKDSGDVRIFGLDMSTDARAIKDRIGVVLDDGGIAGIGTHEQLMGSCALYREIAASQAKEALQ